MSGFVRARAGFVTGIISRPLEAGPVHVPDSTNLRRLQFAFHFSNTIL